MDNTPKEKARQRAHAVGLAGWVYRKFIVRLLELDDPPKKIARGIAIGVFIAMTPTVGIQMITIALLCTIFIGNRLAGVAMAWISNPLTIVPIYWLDYVIGSLILRTPMVGKGEIARLVQLESTGWFGMFIEFMGNLGSMTFHLAGPMFLGGVILGIACALPAYFIALPLFTKWKEAFRKHKEKAAQGSFNRGDAEKRRGHTEKQRNNCGFEEEEKRKGLNSANLRDSAVRKGMSGENKDGGDNQA